MTRRVCEYHWERTFRQTLCLRALAANLCSSSSCLESDLSGKIGQTLGFSAKLCVSKWRSFVSCYSGKTILPVTCAARLGVRGGRNGAHCCSSSTTSGVPAGSLARCVHWKRHGRQASAGLRLCGIDPP